MIHHHRILMQVASLYGAVRMAMHCPLRGSMPSRSLFLVGHVTPPEASLLICEMAGIGSGHLRASTQLRFFPPSCECWARAPGGHSVRGSLTSRGNLSGVRGGCWCMHCGGPHLAVPH